MKGLLQISLLVAITSSSWAQEDRRISPRDLDYTTADESNPLPKSLTPAERLIPFDKPTRQDFDLRSPPTGTIYCPAEYEHQEGLFIAWEGYTSLLIELTVGITTGDPEAVVYVVVDSSSEQSSAYGSLSGAGADMDQVEFIIRTTDTVWIRDYGSRFIFEDGSRAIIDHNYNRPRPNDNLLNDYVSTLWGEPQYDIPLTHGGGNFHLFANADAFMTDLILTENPGLSEQDVIDLYHDYQNVNLTIYPGFPTWFDSTQHIDMWMLPLGDDQVIIGEYASSTGQPYTITENAVTDLTNRGYTVYRTPGWNSSGTHYTYTNAVIINDQVFISKFNVSQDAQAKTVFETALPDHTVIQLDCSSIIHAAGAIHCIVMHVPAYPQGLIVTPADDLIASGDAGGPFTPDSIVYTLENDSDGPIDYSVTKSEAWVSVTNATGTIPAQGTISVTVSINSAAETLGHGEYADTVYFTNTTDHQGDTTRGVTLTVGVPELIYSFDMDQDPGWSTEGQWAWGDPTGSGGEYGEPDPDTGYTGSYVYGYNLNGDYEDNLSERHLTTTALDCTDLTDVGLSFWRWLGVEQSPFDHAYLRVSTNGTDWTTIWQNGSTVEDSSWNYQEFDISGIADGQPTVYLRWTMGATDNSGRYCGWNIDDVEIWAVDTSSPGVITAARSCLNHDAAGELCLELDTVNIEPRFDGVQMLEFDVSEPASTVNATLECFPDAYAGTPVVTADGGTTVTVELDPALPDRSCCEITLTGDVEDTYQVRTLAGDLNQNGDANTTDASQIKLYFGQSAGSGNCAFDYNCDGTINTTDSSQIKLQFGHSAAACP